MGDNEGPVDELRDLRAEVAQLKFMIEDRDEALKKLEEKADELEQIAQSMVYDCRSISAAAKEARR